MALLLAPHPMTRAATVAAWILTAASCWTAAVWGMQRGYVTPRGVAIAGAALLAIGIAQELT